MSKTSPWYGTLEIVTKISTFQYDTHQTTVLMSLQFLNIDADKVFDNSFIHNIQRC